MDGNEFMERIGGVRKYYDFVEDCEKEEIVKKMAFKEITRYLKVLARCTPDVKYTLVKGLME